VRVIANSEFSEDVASFVRAARAGEEFTITVEGRPAATLGPVKNRCWVDGTALKAMFQTPPPKTMGRDLERFPG
jgi:prevent-host-death family protein